MLRREVLIKNYNRQVEAKTSQVQITQKLSAAKDDFYVKKFSDDSCLTYAKPILSLAQGVQFVACLFHDAPWNDNPISVIPAKQTVLEAVTLRLTLAKEYILPKLSPEEREKAKSSDIEHRLEEIQSLKIQDYLDSYEEFINSKLWATYYRDQRKILLREGQYIEPVLKELESPLQALLDEVRWVTQNIRDCLLTEIKWFKRRIEDCGLLEVTDGIQQSMEDVGAFQAYRKLIQEYQQCKNETNKEKVLQSMINIYQWIQQNMQNCFSNKVNEENQQDIEDLKDLQTYQKLVKAGIKIENALQRMVDANNQYLETATQKQAHTVGVRESKQDATKSKPADNVLVATEAGLYRVAAVISPTQPLNEGAVVEVNQPESERVALVTM